MRKTVSVGIIAMLAALSAGAAEFSLKVAEKAPPDGMGAEIGAELAGTAIQLMDGDAPVYEFWFRKEIPLKAKPESLAKALDQVAEVTLLGVVVVSKKQRDYRDEDVLENTYTMRLGLIPSDGNHLGASEFPYFILCTPVKIDTTLKGFPNTEAMVEASSADTPGEHPVVLSIRPVTAASGDYPRLEEPADEHKSVRVKLSAVADGEKTDLVFDMVYAGVGHL